MVLRGDDNSSDADPFRRFNQALDALLGQMASPVAFATLPLDSTKHARTAAQKPREHTAPQTPSTGPTSSESASLLHSCCRGRSETDQARCLGKAEESFYVVADAAHVPTTSSPSTAAFLPSRLRTSSHSMSAGSSPAKMSHDKRASLLGSTKTVEELAHENATLKEALNTLSLQYEQAVSHQTTERESLKQSIMSLRTDFKKESERAMMRSAVVGADGPSQSVQHLHQQQQQQSNAATQVPAHEDESSSSNSGNGQGAPGPSLQAEVDRLKAELHSARASAQKCTSAGREAPPKKLPCMHSGILSLRKNVLLYRQEQIRSVERSDQREEDEQASGGRSQIGQRAATRGSDVGGFCKPLGHSHRHANTFGTIPSLIPTHKDTRMH